MSLFLVLFVVLIFSSLAAGDITFTKIGSTDEVLIPLSRFGFTPRGWVELNITHLSFSGTTITNQSFLSNLGFFLTSIEDMEFLARQIEDGDNKTLCAFNDIPVQKVFTFDQLPSVNASELNLIFPESNTTIYALGFANCIPNLRVYMNVRSAMYYLEGERSNTRRNYLSARESAFPLVYFIFSTVYATLCVAWVIILYKKKLHVYRIHMVMLLVIVLKTLNLFFEAEDKHHVKQTGSPHGWDIVFFIFSFLKGFAFFSLIAFIGAGWSILKPHLRENTFGFYLFCLGWLQVIANILRIMINKYCTFDGAYAGGYFMLFFLIDIWCCMFVLGEFERTIKILREDAKKDGKAAVDFRKLTLFKQYYIVVMCYYFTTRYVFAVLEVGLEIADTYKYFWTGILFRELTTIAFFLFTGYRFKPEETNPYFEIVDEEEDEGEATSTEQSIQLV